MNTDVLTKIIECILTVVVLLLTTVVIPWIKSKISASDLEQLKKYAEIGVRCAEQMFSEEQYSNKKVFVTEYIQDIALNKLHLNLSAEDINNIIEATVNAVKYGTEYSRK